MSGDWGGGVSSIQTAALLAPPEPRSIAGRPIDWIADMIFEGGVVDVVVRIWFGSEKSVFSMPGRVERAPDMSLMQASQVMGMEKVAW